MVLHRIQRALLFPRGFVRGDDAIARRVPRLERWWHETEAGAVEAWFVPGEGVSADRPGPAVLHAHGNAELIEHWVEPLARYRRLGVSLLLVEYRGYGRSAGRPGEEAIRADTRAFYDRLVARPEVDASKVVLHGRSLGGGAVCAVADARPAAGLVLESTFTSVPEVVRWAPRFAFADVFDNRRVLAGLDAPVLLMHGRRDDLVPFAHAERNQRAARDAELLPFRCGHNALPPDPRPYWAAIERLLHRAGAVRR